MGIKLFSSSSYDGYEPTSSVEPDPSNFSIREIYNVNGHTVAVVNYPNCTNYEGNKILFFKDKTIANIGHVKLLDPHFSDNDENAPFARFEPTREGLEAARKLAYAL